MTYSSPFVFDVAEQKKVGLTNARLTGPSIIEFFNLTFGRSDPFLSVIGRIPCYY